MPIQLDGTTGISTTGNIISNGTITATNIALNNINTVGNISAAGNITAGGALTVGSFAATTLSASGNVTGGNLVTAGAISAASVSASGNITGGNVNAAGLSLSGNVVSAINSTSAITTTANVSANYFIGNGASLTGFDTSFIDSGNSNVKVYANANVATSVNGVANVLVVTNTGLNITGTVSANGNVTGGNVLTGGLISATGNITGSYIFGNGSQLTGIDATSIQNGTSNVRVVSSGGNVTVGIGGTSNVAVFATTGEYVTGDISASGNITGGNIITSAAVSAASLSLSGASQAASYSASGNVTGGNLVTGAAVSAASVSASGNITGGNVLVGNIRIESDTIHSANSVITIDPATTGNAGLVVINGNLQVNGNTTTINSNVVSTNDLTVNYANNAINSAAANGGGIEVGPIGSPFITWLYNNTSNVWTSSGGISAVGNIAGGNVNATNYTGTTVSVSGQVTGSQFNGSGAGLTSIPGANVTGTVPSATTAGTVTTAAQGNITSVGTLTGLTINNATTAITNGATAGTGNIGASGAGFNTIFAKATSAQYADLAEKYSADADYAPGTVLVFGGDREVTVSNTASDHRIAGVVSTNPAHLMNSELDCEYPVAIALTGRTPTRVTGLIHKGDLMISAGNGAAMACATPVVGTVIGKALENFDGESGVIEVVVGVR